MKRQTLCSRLLALVLVLAMLPIYVQAAEIASGTCGGNVTWSLATDGTMTISGTGTMDSFEGSENDADQPWAELRADIKSVVIKSGVTGIGEYAFYNCSNLTKVELPDSIVEINPYAFYDCTSLTKVSIPKNVETLSGSAFWNCPNLTAITVDKANTSYCSDSNGILFDYGKTELLLMPGSFKGAYTVPDTVTWIEECAFADCVGLTSIHLSQQITFLGEHAFLNCPNLTAITVEQGNEYYFSDSRGVLYNQEVTQLVVAPSALKGDYTIPSGVKRIHACAFEDCASLTRLYIPSSVTRVGEFAFARTTKLEYVYFGGSQSQWENLGVEHLDHATISYDCTSMPATPTPVVDPASFKGATLSLNGIISVNFYAEISQEALNTAEIVFTVNDTTHQVPASQATLKDGLYVFSCEVAAKEMADDITAQIYVDGKTVGKPITYSVQQYCENKLAKDDTKATLKNLLVAMLNYGTAAQNYFSYHTDTPANSVLTDKQKAMEPITAEMLESFQLVKTGEAEGISKTGASLLLEAETVVRYRVQLKDGYDINDYPFQYQGKTLTPVAAGDNVYYVDITGIAAKDLDEFYPISIGDVQISYSPITYVYNQLEKAPNLVTALYYYNQMANTYFA